MARAIQGWQDITGELREMFREVDMVKEGS